MSAKNNLNGTKKSHALCDYIGADRQSADFVGCQDAIYMVECKKEGAYETMAYK